MIVDIRLLISDLGVINLEYLQLIKTEISNQ